MTAMRLATIAAFVIGIAGAGVVELLARREGSKLPTLSDLCAFVMRYRVGPLPVGRIALFGFWWWVGWHFFAR